MIQTFTRATLAGVFALGLVGAAQAQSIPTPANPTPAFPIATDGTPLPPRVHDYGTDGLLSGRSAFAPVGGVVDGGLGAANAVVDGTTGAFGLR